MTQPAPLWMLSRASSASRPSSRRSGFPAPALSNGLSRRCARQESNLRPRAPEARALSPELLAPGRRQSTGGPRGCSRRDLASFRPRRHDAGDGGLSPAAGGLRPPRALRGVVRLLSFLRVEVPAALLRAACPHV